MKVETDLEILLKKPAPQDIIAAIFAHSDLKTFTNDRQKIQAFVRENKTGEAAELLEPFIFSEGVDIYPYSRLLESVLSCLCFGEVIFVWSPKEDGYNMEEEMRQRVIVQTKKRFSPKEVVIIKSLGRRWREFNARQA